MTSPHDDPTTLAFTIEGRNGRATYEVAQHRPTEGTVIALRLGALIVEPLVTAAGPVVMSALSSARLGEGKADAAAIKRALLDDPKVRQAINLPAIGAGLKTALATLRPADLYGLLRHAMRNGRSLVDQSGMPTEAFEEAFARNYGELLRVALKVAVFNDFFPGISTFVELLGRMGAQAKDEALATLSSSSSSGTPAGG